MKKIFFLTLFLGIAAFFSPSLKAQTEAQKIELCTKAAGDANLLNSYTIQLAAANDGERAPVFRHAVAFQKGNRFRLTVCTDEESAGEAIIQLYDEGKMIASNHNPETGKIYQSFDFDCSKTARYTFIISIKDGKEGSAVAVVSHVKTL